MKPFFSAKDPYILPETDEPLNIYQKVSYKTAVAAQGIVGGETTAVWLSLGQSTTANNDDTQYTPTSAKAQNFNPYDGAVYPAATPLLGCQGLGGNWNARCADKLIAAGIWQRVIIVPIGVGNSTSGQWSQSGVLFERVAATKRRLDNAGLPVTFTTWMDGETDNSLGTSQASYAASFASLVSGLRAIGISTPIFISQTTLTNNTTSAAVRAAQAAAVNNPAGIYAGPDTDTLTGATNRQQSGVSPHFTATGSDACAALWKTAIDAVF